MKRVLTAAILAPLIVYVVAWAPAPAFLAVLLAVALLCFYEYNGLVAGHGIERPGILGYVAGLSLLLVPQDPIVLLTLVAILGLVLGLAMDDFRRALPRAGALVLGVAYVFGPWKCAMGLRAIDPYWLLFALAVNWVGDIAALYTGRTFGKHKLAPRVSPGKSWEGAVGSVIASLIFAAIYLPRLIPTVSVPDALLLGLAANVAGQVGDLCESAMKRGAAVKDSSNLLPGHGGWLDRVDSSLFTLPVTYWIVLQPWLR